MLVSKLEQHNKCKSADVKTIWIKLKYWLLNGVTAPSPVHYETTVD